MINEKKDDKLRIPRSHMPIDLGPELASIDMFDENAFTPADYCSAVSAFFAEQVRDMRKSGAGHYLFIWDQWSLALNKMWVQRCHDKTHNSLSTHAALVFWWNRNEYLRLLANKPLLKETRKRRLNKDAKVIYSIAAGNRASKKINTKFCLNITRNYFTIYNHLRQYFEKVAAKEAKGEGS